MASVQDEARRSADTLSDWPVERSSRPDIGVRTTFAYSCHDRASDQELGCALASPVGLPGLGTLRPPNAADTRPGASNNISNCSASFADADRFRVPPRAGKS